MMPVRLSNGRRELNDGREFPPDGIVREDVVEMGEDRGGMEGGKEKNGDGDGVPKKIPMVQHKKMFKVSVKSNIT